MTTAPRRLRKSASDKLLLGVAGGLAEYWNVDSTILRVGFVLFSFVTGVGLLLYVILALLMPRAESTALSPGRVIGENVETIGQQAEEAGQRLGEAVRDITGEGRSSVAGARGRVRSTQYAVGLILVAVGVFILFINFGAMWWFNWARFWPLVLIAVGLLLLVTQLSRKPR